MRVNNLAVAPSVVFVFYKLGAPNTSDLNNVALS